MKLKELLLKLKELLLKLKELSKDKDYLKLKELLKDKDYVEWLLNWGYQEIARHFGYNELQNPEIFDQPLKAFQVLKCLPPSTDTKKKFRVIFDYDPEYPIALRQICYEGR